MTAECLKKYEHYYYISSAYKLILKVGWNHT